MIHVDTITAPAHWASYLVNGDASGLSDDERAQVDAWCAKIAPWYVASCEGDAWLGWRDGVLTELCTYVVHTVEVSHG